MGKMSLYTIGAEWYLVFTQGSASPHFSAGCRQACGSSLDAAKPADPLYVPVSYVLVLFTL